jgi:glycerol-3-phosphate dehydrogenase (NAD(P)+)
MTQVAVLGSGVMASALSVPLADNGHDVRLVGTHLDREIIDSVKASRIHPGLDVQLPASVKLYQLEEARDAFSGAEIVLSGVNSFGVSWAGERLAGLLPGGALVIAIAKGLEAGADGNLRILPDVLTDSWSELQRADTAVSAITGPSIAGEVAVRRDTCVVFAGRDHAALRRLAAVFQTESYRVWTSTDLVGCEVCAAFKNCYALGVGLAEGVLEARGASESLDRMHNYEAALFAQGAAEMRKMVALLGGSPDTSGWLPGVGDMYVTSTGGRNVRLGRLLGAGARFAEASAQLGHPTLEGAAAIREIGAALPKLGKNGIVDPEDFPLLGHLYEVIELGRPVDMPWSSFFGGDSQTALSGGDSRPALADDRTTRGRSPAAEHPGCGSSGQLSPTGLVTRSTASGRSATASCTAPLQTSSTRWSGISAGSDGRLRIGPGDG